MADSAQEIDIVQDWYEMKSAEEINIEPLLKPIICDACYELIGYFQTGETIPIICKNCWKKPHTGRAFMRAKCFKVGSQRPT